MRASRRILVLSHHGRAVAGGATLADAALAAGLAERGDTVDLLFFEEVLPDWARATWRLLLYPWAAARAFLRRHGEARYDVIESTAGDAWVIDLLRACSPDRAPCSRSVPTAWSTTARSWMRSAGGARGGRPAW